MTAATAPIIAYEPPPPYDGMRVSEADYWAYYSEEREPTWEWNDGVLEEKGVSDHLTFKVVDWFVQLLIDYLRGHPGTERLRAEAEKARADLAESAQARERARAQLALAEAETERARAERLAARLRALGILSD